VRAAIALPLVVAVSGCVGDPAPGQSGQNSARAAAAPQTAKILRVTPAPYQLPVALSGEAASAVGGRLMVAGGLLADQTSSRLAFRVDPRTGQAIFTGHLAMPVHDAASATLAGRYLVFGGGVAASYAAVQQPSRRGGSVVGSLPAPRSDLAAVQVGRTAYLVGGHGNSGDARTVLATRDGRHFTVVARLPVPVRYPAVAASGGILWIFGGLASSGPVSDVQRVDLASGAARVAARLPRPLTAAAAFVLDGTVYVAGGLTTSGPASRAGSASSQVTTPAVLRFDETRRSFTAVGALPVPVAHAAVAVTGTAAYLLGGVDGARTVGTVTRFTQVRAEKAVASPWFTGSGGKGYLTPGSEPAALPTDVLVADHQNNRLVVIDPRGRIRWVFPRPGDLARGQTFLVPDDAFFSPDGRYIIATQEDDQVISIIDVARHRIVYRYGKPGVPGMGTNRLSNPDDAMLTPAGDIIAADIKNCSIIMIRPPAHRPLKIIGHQTNACTHDPPYYFGSPNGAFPMTNGHYLVTEINGSWVNELSLSGKVFWSVHPPGVLYPSDANEVAPGRYLVADYSTPGQVVEFNSRGRLLWRFGGLNSPSLAVGMPNGDILVNDDFNDRVIVIDPVTDKIVWQYGHTGVAGSRPGYLNDPDGLDLVPADSLLMQNAPTMGQP